MNGKDNQGWDSTQEVGVELELDLDLGLGMGLGLVAGLELRARREWEG